MSIRDIIYNGEKIGITWCEGCARRYVRMRLWKKGFRDPSVGEELRANKVITATTLEYRYDENQNKKFPIN